MENRRNFIKKTSLLSLGMVGYGFNLPIIKILEELIFQLSPIPFKLEQKIWKPLFNIV